MSKYQEALNKLKRNFKIKSNTLEEMIIVEEDNERQLKVLQEAIDKAIIYDDKEKGINVKYTTTGISYCGNCSNSSLHNYLGNEMIYCSKCGYKIIWRKDK